MTERLYYTHDALQCTARLIRTSLQDDGRYAVVLDQTLFHPQGGGQPADTGWINGVVVESVLQQDDEIIHLLAQPLPREEVTLQVDAVSRALHTQLHSAGHLIGYAGELHGWQPIKAHHWPGEGRITFNATDSASVPDIDALSEHIAHWQAAALPRIVTFDAGRRTVRFGDLPAYGCGGTHVPSLAALGQVVISNIKIKKGQLIVYYTVQ